MQRSEFVSQKQSLGTGPLYTVSPKAKGKLSGFCKTGCGLVWVDSDGKCPSCHTAIIKKLQYDSYVKLFEAVIQNNGQSLYQIMESGYQMTVPILMNGTYCFVPVSEFVRFDQIRRNSPEDTKHKMFFHNILNTCKTVRIL